MRCVNIDWLECYCVEDSLNFPHDAAYFEAQGYEVISRDYGTRVYGEMFTVFGRDGLPYCEVRRAPLSVVGRNQQGVLPPGSAHVRLVNRSCYFATAAASFALFLDTHGFAVKRISRIDICLDFVRFDSGDFPEKFLQRFMQSKFAKINQSNIHAHGRDVWVSRRWSSVSWGAPSSMVTTRFYNKSKELREVKDKPYIRQAWAMAGLVDDPQELWALDSQGRKYYPEVWRVEFAIKSGTKGWFVMEDCNGTKRKLRSVRNTLDCYYTKQQLLDCFFGLADHYFHFKHIEFIERKDSSGAVVRELKRKDRCADKVLFIPRDRELFVDIERVATTAGQLSKNSALEREIRKFLAQSVDPKVSKACYIILDKIKSTRIWDDNAVTWSDEEVTFIRRLVAERMEHRDTPFADTIKYLRDSLANSKDIFGEGAQ